METEDIEYIVDIAHTKLEHSNFSSWISEIFSKKNLKHRLINSSDYDYININNFKIYGIQGIVNEVVFANMYENCMDFVENPDVKPFRKVFISRKDHEIMRNSPIDTRCDDQKALEDIFIANGFEICYPEKDFNSFSEQVSYFYESKIVVGLSGGGLTNTVFMQPSQIVMELLTTFKFMYGPGLSITEELHDYYQHIAYLKKHMLISISNIDRKTKSIEEMLTKFNVF
jgi:capsular polysaccharide biosynthesis protein